MTVAAELMLDGFARVQESVHQVLADSPPGLLIGRVDPGANTVAWLVWHLSRVQDDHIAEVAGTGQVWLGGWSARFGLPFDPDATGYGQSPEEVGQVNADADLLAGYHDAVVDATKRYLGTLTDSDYERVVDERWDPPVTLGVRLVSVLNDCTQHIGQAALLRGVLERIGA